MTTEQRVQQQIKLPFRKAISIAWKNIRVRFLRSMLVTSEIILALAFLTNILCSDAVDKHLIEHGPPQLLETLRSKGAILASAEPDTQIQTWWLAGLALLVCFIGILNAMLMSVTERFSEIGTMKCLGAVDALIIKLFLLESAFQGLVGASIGIVIGLTLALIQSFVTFGLEIWYILPVNVLIRFSGMCLLAGTLLTIAAGLYPAWRAAKMQPVDAMRSEV